MVCPWAFLRQRILALSYAWDLEFPHFDTFRPLLLVRRLCLWGPPKKGERPGDHSCWMWNIQTPTCGCSTRKLETIIILAHSFFFPAVGFWLCWGYSSACFISGSQFVFHAEKAGSGPKRKSWGKRRKPNENKKQPTRKQMSKKSWSAYLAAETVQIEAVTRGFLYQWFALELDCRTFPDVHFFTFIPSVCFSGEHWPAILLGRIYLQNIQTSDTHRNPPCRNLGMLVAFYFVGKCWMPIRCNMLSGGFLWSFDGAKQVGSWPGRGLSMPGWLRILDTLVEGWWGTISWKKDLRKSWNDQTLYYIMYV